MSTLNVLNRYSEAVEIQFDAAFNPDSPYRWEPGEVKALPQDAALFCRRKSVIKDNPITGKLTRALVIQGMDPEYDTVEVVAPRGAELLDRTDMTGPAAPERITLVPLANPVARAQERDTVQVESRARRAR